MKATKLAIALLLINSAGIAAAEDSVQIVSVAPAVGAKLARGKPIRFQLVVHYELTSKRSAILSLSLEQLRSRVSGCKVDPSDAKAGELVKAVSFPIKKGTGEIKAEITWPGDTGKVTGGRVYGSGYVTFVPMFWEDVAGTRGNRFRMFPEASDYCYGFGP